jgi:cation diffusion facilitator CzcD-associated flavoprotein CzcO
MSERAMTILVVGAGNTGVQVLRQLLKNPRLKILTLDPRDNPAAIQQGLLENVDFKEALTPLTLDAVLKAARPDLILLTSTAQDMGLGETVGIDMLSDALRDELATISDVPVIEVARSTV